MDRNNRESTACSPHQTQHARWHTSESGSGKGMDKGLVASIRKICLQYWPVSLQILAIRGPQNATAAEETSARSTPLDKQSHRATSCHLKINVARHDCQKSLSQFEACWCNQGSSNAAC